MKLSIFSINFAFLQVICFNPRNHWTLLPNTLVLEVDGTLGQFPLSCLAEDHLRRYNQTQEIIWRKNGAEEVQRGNLYHIQLVESFGGGNYTCHSKDGSLLNHTEVLILQDETNRRRILVKTEQEDYLKCSTQNYNGEFHCSWTWHISRIGKVAFVKVQRVSDDNPQCSVDRSDQHWRCSSAHSNISCSVDNSGRGITCQDQRHCPFAEETHQIFITVYVKTDHFLLESYSKLFYLSDIVKPDKVKIGKVNKTLVEWSYPSSWNTPYSYFPLTFQVFQVKGRCKKCENPCLDLKLSKTSTVQITDICQLKLKHRVRAVCVRAKDALCDSYWSEWSHVRLRTNRKNKNFGQRQNFA